MSADIIALPLPPRDVPQREGWYVDMSRPPGGVGSIYVLTKSGRWVMGGRELQPHEIPSGLRRLGIVS